MSKERKTPRLLKVEGIAWALELRQLLETVNAMEAWMNELPDPIHDHIGHLLRIGVKATGRSERMHGLWNAECWFFMYERADRRAAREWLYEHGDDWMDRDPRRRPTYAQALRAAQRTLKKARGTTSTE